MSAIAFRNRVLNFWFSNNRWAVADKPPAKSMPVDESDLLRWFESSKEFDKQIQDKFEGDLVRLINDEYRYPNDLNHPEHLLACIIALDQFPRNIYRHDPRAFAYDSKARELSELLISYQGDKQLPYVERAFSYLPFEHSENLDDQNRAVRYFQELYQDAENDSTSKKDILNLLKEFIIDSEQHRNIIKQYGRFPHRNAVLKRQSLESEDLYLNNGGERFGQ
jgi:uncharacterized protein (DUF924 family)